MYKMQKIEMSRNERLMTMVCKIYEIEMSRNDR